MLGVEPAGLILISFLRCCGYEVCKRDDFVAEAVYFNSVQRFEYRDDMFSFGGSSYCTSKEVLQ